MGMFVTELPANALEHGAPYALPLQAGNHRPAVRYQLAAVVANLSASLSSHASLLQVGEMI